MILSPILQNKKSFCNIEKSRINTDFFPMLQNKTVLIRLIIYLSEKNRPPKRKRFFINLYSAYIGWIMFLLSSSLPLMPTRSFLLFWKKSIATFGNCA